MNTGEEIQTTTDTTEAANGKKGKHIDRIANPAPHPHAVESVAPKTVEEGYSWGEGREEHEEGGRSSKRRCCCETPPSDTGSGAGRGGDEADSADLGGCVQGFSEGLRAPAILLGQLCGDDVGKTFSPPAQVFMLRPRSATTTHPCVVFLFALMPVAPDLCSGVRVGCEGKVLQE